MTREEAIKRLEILLLHFDPDCVMGMETTEAINMAIKALEQPERKTGCLTEDEIKAIRIHMNAFKERLCNQRRWKEAEEYQQIVDKLDVMLLQPEPRWVPCSERCPVKEGRYIATTHPTYSHDKDIEIICWSGRWSRWVGYDEREILAWMPLPEPYKEGEG